MLAAAEEYEMELQVAAALKLPGEVFHAELEQMFPPQTFSGREVRFAQPISLKLSYTFDGKGISLTGDMATVLQSNCARCSEPFLEPLHVALEERFIKGTVENASDDEDAYQFEGDTLELSHMVLDNLFLHLPIVSLCREDCKGLCPNCGCNLNITQCSCQPDDPVKNSPLAALEQLRNVDKEV